MPDDPDAACPPDAENNTPDAPAPRPAPLQYDKADTGCLIGLGMIFFFIFFGVGAVFLGLAPLLVPLLACFLVALATPWINPTERASPKVKWWGRVLTFLFLAGLIVVAWLLLREHLGDRFTVDEQEAQ